MADQKLRQDKSQTLDRTGKAIWVQGPGPTYLDEWMLADDYLSAEQADILANTNAISTLQSDVLAHADALFKRTFLNQNASFTFTQNADSILREFYIGFVSGTPTVAIGTAASPDPDYENIVSDRAVTDFRSILKVIRANTSQTIYITISGGFVDIAVFSRENLFT